MHAGVTVVAEAAKPIWPQCSFFLVWVVFWFSISWYILEMFYRKTELRKRTQVNWELTRSKALLCPFHLGFIAQRGLCLLILHPAERLERRTTGGRRKPQCLLNCYKMNDFLKIQWGEGEGQGDLITFAIWKIYRRDQMSTSVKARGQLRLSS